MDNLADVETTEVRNILVTFINNLFINYRVSNNMSIIPCQTPSYSSVLKTFSIEAVIPLPVAWKETCFKLSTLSRRLATNMGGL